MKVEIITPEKLLFEGESDLVQVPGTMGSFEILKNHAPLISTLVPGNVKVKTTKGEVLYFEIGAGVIEIKNNNIAILVEKI
jgi:F-type H+-transporting ATPase subunit epsilon